jgi:hypothetical protein
MSEPKFGGEDFAQFGREEMQSALFAQLVMQQSNLAMLLLGKLPHPESGKTMRDLDGAKLFIDQLEMLEAKTKGNLTQHEEAWLKQNLMSLRLAFVEAVEAPELPAQPGSEQKTTPAPANKASDVPLTTQDKTPPAAPAEGEGESPKRFSKKFSL